MVLCLVTSTIHGLPLCYFGCPTFISKFPVRVCFFFLKFMNMSSTFACFMMLASSSSMLYPSLFSLSILLSVLFSFLSKSYFALFLLTSFSFFLYFLSFLRLSHNLKSFSAWSRPSFPSYRWLVFWFFSKSFFSLLVFFQLFCIIFLVFIPCFMFFLCHFIKNLKPSVPFALLPFQVFLFQVVSHSSYSVYCFLFIFSSFPFLASFFQVSNNP